MMHGKYVGMIRLISFSLRILDANRSFETDCKIFPGTTSAEAHATLAIPEHVPFQEFRIALRLRMPNKYLYGIQEYIPRFFPSTHVTAKFLLPVDEMRFHPGNWIAELFLPHIECRLGGWLIPVPKCAAIEDDLRVIDKRIISLKDGLDDESDIVHGSVDDILFVAKFEPKVYPVSKFAGATVKAKLTRIADNFVTHSPDIPLVFQGTGLHACISLGDLKAHEGDWQVECLIGERVLATHRFRVVSRQTGLNAIAIDSFSLVAETTSGKFIPVNDTICFASETLNVIVSLILNVPYPFRFITYTLTMKVFRDGDVAGEWTSEVVLRDKASECTLSKIPIPEPKLKDKPTDYKVCIYLDERLIVRTGFRVRPRPPELPHIKQLLLNGDLDSSNLIAPTSDRQLSDGRKEGRKTTTRRKKAS